MALLLLGTWRSLERGAEVGRPLGAEPQTAEHVHAPGGGGGPSMGGPVAQGLELSLEDQLRLFEDEEYLVEFTKQHGPEVAVATLSASQGPTSKDCHYPSHAVGAVAYEEFGPQAFHVVGHLCQSGAMHSVVEAVLGEYGTENLGRDVDDWCGEAGRPFNRHNCIHGVGHGLLVWADYDVPEALVLCEQLPDEEDRYSCDGGVFMENVRDVLSGTMAMKEEHPERYLRSDDPHFPCNVLEERHLPACYFYQSSVMFEYYGRQFEPVIEECASLSEDLQSWCFRSVGRDIAHHLREDPQGVLEVCLLGPELPNRLDCIEEAVQHRFWDTLGADWVIDFCARVEGPDENERCYWKIAQRATELYDTPEEFRGFCARFESGYVWLCDFVLYQQIPEFAEWGRTEWIAATPASLRDFRDRCLAVYDENHCVLTVFFQLQQLNGGGPAAPGGS